MRMFPNSPHPLHSPDDAGGAAAPVDPATTVAPATDIPPAPPAEPVVPAPDFAAMTEQLLAAQEQQAAQLRALQEQLMARATPAPRPEDDLRSDEQKRLDAINERTERMEQLFNRQQTDQVVGLALTQTGQILDQLANADPIARGNVELTNTLKQQIAAIVEPQVRSNPNGHGITRTHVTKWFKDLVATHKRIHDAWPGQTAAVAAAQVTANQNAPDVGGGASPSRTDAAQPPKPDSDQYWNAKNSQAAAVWNRYAQR